MASKLGRVPSAAWKAVGSHRNGVRVLCSPPMDEEPDIIKELLIQIRDILRSECLQFNGPYWSEGRRRVGNKGWYISAYNRNPDYVHEATWIVVDEDFGQTILCTRHNGRTSYIDFSLYEENCFERLVEAARKTVLKDWLRQQNQK